MDFQILINRFKTGTDKLREKQSDLYKAISEDADLVSSIALAHADMARRAQGHSENIKKSSIEFLVNRFTTSSPFIYNNIDFDKWHQETCEKYCEVLNEQYGTKFKMTYGRAQKVLNMMFKYLYCTKKYKQEIEKLIDVLHMTLDGYTLNWVKNYVNHDKSIKKISEWSKMEKEEYLAIQKRIKEYLPAVSIYYYSIKTNGKTIQGEVPLQDANCVFYDDPFLAEFIIWEGEIICSTIKNTFAGIEKFYEDKNKNSWIINSSIKNALKSKLKNFIDNL